eukprot:6179751-Pleurochrysis_carterae.AAC.1
MGDAAEGTAGVGLDTVETLRPLLKMREAKAERLMQEVVKAQMMKMMGDQGDGGAAAGGEVSAAGGGGEVKRASDGVCRRRKEVGREGERGEGVRDVEKWRAEQRRWRSW